MKQSRKEHLVDTALKLFYRHGFHATGIDTILAESGVAKMTMYKYFKSKDQLIVAVLQRRDELWMNWFEQTLEAKEKSPRKQLLAIFDVLEEWFKKPDFAGCMFINVAAEYAGISEEIHQEAEAHKQKLLTLLKKTCEAAGVADAKKLSSELLILCEGAIVTAMVFKQPSAAQDAKRAAKILVQSTKIRASRSMARA